MGELRRINTCVQAVPGDCWSSCTPMEKVPRCPIQQEITTELSLRICGQSCIPLAGNTTCTLLGIGGFVNGELVKSISSECIEEERRFASTQEEADIRMLLHAGFC